MDIGTCLQEGCQLKKIHYHCPVEDCNFIFEVVGECCPTFTMHVHCRLCEATNMHVHCNRCQRGIICDGLNYYNDINLQCEYCDLGGNCDKCGIFLPNIKKQTYHKFCDQCNICVDTHKHLHCPTCNVITGPANKHHHCHWCSNLNKHSHIRDKWYDGTIQTCGVEGCSKMYKHMHCNTCDWINNYKPYKFHEHCSTCDRTDYHNH